MQQYSQFYGEVEQQKEEEQGDEDWEMQDESVADDEEVFDEDEDRIDQELEELSKGLQFNIEEYLKIRDQIEPSLYYPNN